MTSITLYLRGGGILLVHVEDAEVMLLVERWSTATVASNAQALHYKDPVDGSDIIRFVRMVDVVAVEYVLDKKE